MSHDPRFTFYVGQKVRVLHPREAKWYEGEISRAYLAHGVLPCYEVRVDGKLVAGSVSAKYLRSLS